MSNYPQQMQTGLWAVIYPDNLDKWIPWLIRGMNLIVRVRARACMHMRVHIFSILISSFSETFNSTVKRNQHVSALEWELGFANTRDLRCTCFHTLSNWLRVGIKHSPSLLIAEFFGDHFAQIEPEAVGHFLGQVMVGAPAKQHDVGHCRTARALLQVRTDGRKEQ